jgi:hydrocephalus-inducing protein
MQRCALVKISYADPNPADWDDRDILHGPTPPRLTVQPPKKQVGGRRSFARNRSGSKAGASASEEKELSKTIELKPEPEHTELPEKLKEITLAMSFACDYVKLLLSHKQLSFGPTMMLEKESVRVTMKNLSQIRLDYNWIVVKFESLSDRLENPFSISPSTGMIEAGTSSTFVVTFSPPEVDDFRAIFRCEVIGAQEMPELELTGFSKRPICHIDCESCDYLMRRCPGYTSTLPEGVRVMEIISKSVGVLVKKKFSVLNTTKVPYEIFWKEVAGDPAIMCEEERRFVSGGQKYMMEFRFLPSEMKVVEAVWMFEIPSQELKVPFLVVGRIVRPY